MSGIWNLICEEHLDMAKEDGKAICDAEPLSFYEDPICDVEGCTNEGAYEAYDMNVTDVTSMEWIPLDELEIENNET